MIKKMILNLQKRIINFVIKANWVLLVIGSLLGYIVLPFNFALGILIGGLLAIVNFHLLSKTLYKAFAPKKISSHGFVLLQYYIRFIGSGFIIFVMIFFRLANPIGLLLGLSVVVISLMMAAMLELTKQIFKEAV
jgi:hypothetical protein